MRTSELEYELPDGIIAIRPAEPRDAARMMVVKRSDPGFLEHAHVRDLPKHLSAGDLLVFNRTRVLPARIVGVNEQTGGKVDGLFLREAGRREGYHGTNAVAWQVLLKARRVREGATIELIGPDFGEESVENASGLEAGGSGQEQHSFSGVRFVVLHRARGSADDQGASEFESGEGWIVGVELAKPDVEWGSSPDEEIWRKLKPGETEGVLQRVGHTPLPPYILASRRLDGTPIDAGERIDRARYQTVYAREGGSIAAPTAGLHFTPRLLEELDRMSVERAEVLLHVGTGTFKPVEAERLEDHPMHTEWCSMSNQVCSRVAGNGGQPEINGGQSAAHRRVIAVGTTSVRTLESYALAMESGGRGATAFPASLETRLMIRPGYRFRWTDGLMTNFHLPRSTLLALVAAMLEYEGQSGSGIARVRALYTEAMQKGYRFYSFGDSMLILP